MGNGASVGRTGMSRKRENVGLGTEAVYANQQPVTAKLVSAWNDRWMIAVLDDWHQTNTRLRRDVGHKYSRSAVATFAQQTAMVDAMPRPITLQSLVPTLLQETSEFAANTRLGRAGAVKSGPNT